MKSRLSLAYGGPLSRTLQFFPYFYPKTTLRSFEIQETKKKYGQTYMHNYVEGWLKNRGFYMCCHGNKKNHTYNSN